MAHRDAVREVVEHLYLILKVCGVGDQEISRAFEESSKVLTLNSAQTPKVLTVTSRLHIEATAVVATWRRDERFLDESGEPALLLETDDQNGIGVLIEASRVEASPGEVLSYLLDLGIISRRETGGFYELHEDSVLVTRGSSTEPGAVSSDVTIGHVCDFLRTVRTNLTDDNATGPRNFERACYGHLNEDLIPVFRRLVRERGQQYVDSIDEWLDRHPADQKERTVLVGSGAYGILGSNLYHKKQ